MVPETAMAKLRQKAGEGIRGEPTASPLRKSHERESEDRGRWRVSGRHGGEHDSATSGEAMMIRHSLDGPIRQRPL